MPLLIPTEWLSCSPNILVAGDGPYAEALAMIFGTAALSLGALQSGQTIDEAEGYNRLLCDTRAVLLILRRDVSASEALFHHQLLWNWIETLTVGGECHAIGFVFVMHDESAEKMDHSLGTGLAVDCIDPTKCGHAIWRMSGSVNELTALIARIVPKDLQTLKGRLAANSRRKSLKALVEAVERDADDVTFLAAVNSVAAVFKDKEYELDFFCVPPFHPNGRELREWLQSALATPVALGVKKRGKELVSRIRL